MKSLSNPGAVEQRRFDLFACIALALVAVILYVPALGGDFVYDARLTVLGNDYVHHLGNLFDVVTLRVMHMDVMDNNRPVFLASHILNWAVWGPHSFGHHLASVLLHATVALLLFKTCRGLLPETSPWIPLFAALLFTVHPLNAESVSEISYRNDLTVAACLLGAFNLAMLFKPEYSRRNLFLGAACTACVFLAIGSKENGVVGAPLLICYWLLFRRNEPRKGWLVLCSAVTGVTVLFLAARFILRPEHSAIFTVEPPRLGGTFSGTMDIQPLIWTFYLRQIVWPVDFCADYGLYSLRNFDLMFCWLVIIGVVCAQAVIALQNRAFALGAILFWCALLPVSNIVPIYKPMADRFMYLPLAGVVLMLASLPWSHKFVKNIALVLAAIATCALTAVTFQREKVWHDSVSLWSDTTQKNPRSDSAWSGYGNALFIAGKYKESVEAYKSAVTLTRGKIADYFAGAALSLDALGRTVEADGAYRQAVKLDANYGHPEKLLRSLVWEKSEAAKLQVIVDRNKSAGK